MQIVEKAYQQTKNFDRLSFFVPYCGTLVSVSHPPFPSWSCTNWQADPLAYLTAKTNGLEEEAAEILEVAGLTKAEIGRASCRERVCT